MINSRIFAPVANILSNPQKDWKAITTCARGNIRTAYRELDVDWKTYNQKDYLFAHVTILSSCQVEDNGYRIVEPCDELVNANGNAWSNEVIKHCYKTFIGGQVYRDHIQISSLSKGKILDAILRPVTHKGKNGKQAQVFYCDILVATNRKHEELVSRIQSGQLNTLSMGTICSHTQCSICGKIIGQDDKNCKHLEESLGKYVQVDGKKYKCAELIGAFDKNGNYIQDSCHFIQASWVDHPAFAGAVVNYLMQNQKGMKFSSKERQAQIDELTQQMFMNLRVADVSSKMALDLAKQQLKIRRMARNILK